MFGSDYKPQNVNQVCENLKQDKVGVWICVQSPKGRSSMRKPEAIPK